MQADMRLELKDSKMRKDELYLLKTERTECWAE